MSKSRKHIVVATAVAFMLLLGGVVAAVTTTRTGGAINKVWVVSDVQATTTSTESFGDLPGASIDVRTGKGGDLLLMRFTAESRCVTTGETADKNWCAVRILVDDTEAEPAAGADFAFDSTLDDDEGAHAMDRSLRVARGAHTVKVQVQVTDDNANSTVSFTLDDWSLTVERSK